MSLTFLDILNTSIQSILLSWLTYYFLCKDGTLDFNQSKKLPCINMVSLFFIISCVTKIIGGIPIAPVIMDILCISATAVIYNKLYSKAIIGYITVYLSISISSTITSMMSWFFMDVFGIKILSITPLFMYFISFVIEFCIYLFRDKIYEVYKLVTKRSFGMEMVLILVFILDFILSFAVSINVVNEITIYKNMMIFLLLILATIIMTYILRLKKINEENKKIIDMFDEKNSELNKIKHDYGSQLSYINGLYVMEQYERLGGYLKRIIEGNESSTTNIKSLTDPNSIFSNIINSTDLKDVHVVVDEEIDSESFDLPEYDISIIVSNIVRNAITAMNGNGMLFIKTYTIFGNKYISIKNDGPKIDESIIHKIFEPRFSTKEKSDDNGFGLAIIKELVENNNGMIYVYSDDEYTEFKIIFNSKKPKRIQE